MLADLVEDTDVFIWDQTIGTKARTIEGVLNVLEGQGEDKNVNDLLR